MNESDKNVFKELMVGAGELYGKEINKSLMRIYFNALEDLNIDEITRAFSLHVKNTDREGSFFPKPSDLIRQINGDSKRIEQEIDDKAEIAWQTVSGEIKRIGSYGSLKLEDKRAVAAVKAVGGWLHLCSLTTDKMIWAHKEFISAYKTHERTPLELLPDKLPGRVLIENSKKNSSSSGLKSLVDSVNDYKESVTSK